MITLSATALGQKDLIDQNKYLSEYSSEYSHKVTIYPKAKAPPNTLWLGLVEPKGKTLILTTTQVPTKRRQDQSLWVQDYENSFIQSSDQPLAPMAQPLSLAAETIF